MKDMYPNEEVIPKKSHLRIAVESVVLLVVVGLLLAVCSLDPLSRPGPSTEEEYANFCLEYFDTSNVEKVDWVWDGAIGGIMTFARVKFKGPIKLKDILVEGRIKAGKITLGEYDPAKMTVPEAESFEHQWTVLTDGELPAWLDFPFQRKLQTINESNEGDLDGHPRYEKTWYIDDERSLVYFQYFCG